MWRLPGRGKAALRQGARAHRDEGDQLRQAVHFAHLDVALDATLVKYYAIVKHSALHHMRPATP
jgi:hypothetical protein